MQKLKWIILIAILILLAGAFFIYTGNFYHADEQAFSAMESDKAVVVVQTDYGWLFDGPSDETALIFYPGAKVEAQAYAPMLHLLAEKGMDACLVKMPFHLALFDMNKAEFVIREHSYDTWFVGGHSMGGAMAANYAANHGDQISGVILFAAYPTKTLDERLIEISVYGTEDGILNMGKVEKGKTYAPVTFYECVIEGGNHALFGNYGEQKGDGTPTITAQEQQRNAVDFIVMHALSSV